MASYSYCGPPHLKPWLRQPKDTTSPLWHLVPCNTCQYTPEVPYKWCPFQLKFMPNLRVFIHRWVEAGEWNYSVAYSSWCLSRGNIMMWQHYHDTLSPITHNVSMPHMFLTSDGRFDSSQIWVPSLEHLQVSWDKIMALNYRPTDGGALIEAT